MWVKTQLSETFTTLGKKAIWEGGALSKRCTSDPLIYCHGIYRHRENNALASPPITSADEGDALASRRHTYFISPEKRPLQPGLRG